MNLNFEQFEKLALTFNVIPLYDSLPADLDTPVSALIKLKTDEYDFLFESVVGGEKWARYSFLGTHPKKVYCYGKGVFEILEPSTKKSKKILSSNPLEILREEFSSYQVYQDPQLPRFFGGAVGYFGYDLVRSFDKIGLEKTVNGPKPDLFLILTDTVIIFDNFLQLMRVVNTVSIPHGKETHRDFLKTVYDDAIKKIAETKKILKAPLTVKDSEASVGVTHEAQSVSEKNYCQMVTRAQEYIKAGDIFQVVLSLRFELETKGLNPLQVYRSIRRINPSPYMYYLHFNDLTIVGASPEVLVRLEDKRIQVRPIAGTRKRGETDARDQELETELRNDPKERAEHVMLVDLGRNDVGRVAKTGTVAVNENEVIERYSHVMHLVSHVSGVLADDKDVFDVIRSTFPAGTLSGAPKIRAMQIIDELEPASRGIYGGAVGYISFTGNTDLAITIRTAIMQKDSVWVQAGAGIVYNSVPEKEYEECVNKARAMIEAIKKS